ncbi:MAG: phosphatidate cytidylyltransferase [Verrucomicrobia bacterium]|nr:phosphatidate cytidylyltransferase [Verrucomicrobiota bacterium]
MTFSKETGVKAAGRQVHNMLRTLNNFQQRFLATLFSICAAGLIIFSSHFSPFQLLFVAVIAAVQARALWEYYGLCLIKGLEPNRLLSIVFSIFYVLCHYFSPDFPLSESLCLLLALSFMVHLSQHEQAIGNLATTFFGFAYITLPLSLLIDLNFSAHNSSLWIIYLIATTKIADIAAYIVGKTVGRTPLARKLSPKKTVEGAIAGLVAAALMSLLFCNGTSTLSIAPYFSLGQAAVLGLAIGFVSQIGDLAESLLKRDAGVKDSSNIPGFGGILDMVDSVIFTAPLLYFWLTIKGVL